MIGLLLAGCFVTDAELERALDRDRDGFLPVQVGGVDCDETRPDVNPAADEICGDGVDNDCNGVPDDDGIGSRLYYRDADGDGYGVAEETRMACTRPEGFAELVGDCNDADPAFNPFVEDLCDGLDQNCDGQPDDDVLLVERFYDGDGDGFGTVETAIFTCQDDADYVALVGDCNDADPTISPAAVDLCDGIDQNCDGQIDENALSYLQFRDDDQDGFGQDADTAFYCDALPGYAPQGRDCNDADPTISPVAVDLCDGIDQNCDGQADENALFYQQYRDDDQDGFGQEGDSTIYCEAVLGYSPQGGDCNDLDPTVSPVAVDLCDGIDQDCDGLVDDDDDFTLYYPDADDDGVGALDAPIDSCNPVQGYVRSTGDCDDGDPGISPLVVDVCDGIDQDCDGVTDDDAVVTQYYADLDGDGSGDAGSPVLSCSPPPDHVLSSDDCDDGDPTVRPGAADLCDGIDQDCDGAIDEGATFTVFFRDADGDGAGNASNTRSTCDGAPTGYIATAGDCDDTNASVIVPVWYRDMDGDGQGGDQTLQQCTRPAGYRASTGDCDDSDADRSSLFTEVCMTGIDEDCEPETDCRLHDLVFLSDGATFSTPADVQFVEPIGDVVGSSARDFLLYHEDNTVSVVAGDPNPNFASGTRLAHSCASFTTANLSGNTKEEFVCRIGTTTRIYRGGSGALPSTPEGTINGPAQTVWAVSTGPLGPGIWTNNGTQVVFLAYQAGTHTMGSLVASTISLNGTVVPGVPCGAATECLLVSTPSSIHLFEPTSAVSRAPSDAIWSKSVAIPPGQSIGVLPTAGREGGYDIDGDGIGDLTWIDATSSSPVRYLPGPVQSGDSTSGLVITGISGDSIAANPVGDMDGDGFSDFSRSDAVFVEVVYYDQPMSDPAAYLLQSGYDQAGGRFADFDGDGYTDFFIVDRLSDELVVIYGNGI